MLNNAALQFKPEELVQEAYRRQLAQDDLAAYGEYIYSGWFHAHAMHRYIAHYLEQVVSFLAVGVGIENLMVLTPPQHGKSVLVSNTLPSWALGKLPDLRILMGSYGADLAGDNSREVRNIVLSQEFGAVFGKFSSLEEPVRLSADSRSTTKWDLAQPHRGGVIASGVGGAFTGRAKGLALLDDLFKDHRQAESQDYRDDVWDWYRSSVRPRARAKIVVMTHWHPDDIAGRLMKQMVLNPKADQWTIVMLPGFALEPSEYAQSIKEQREKMAEGIFVPLKDALDREPGEVLCPAMLTREQMNKVKETSEDFFFLALYQQMPYTKEGQRFKRNWFKTVTKLPEGVTIVVAVRYWDKANSSKGDYTAGVLMAYCSDGMVYILDVRRKQCTSYERDQMMDKTAKEDQDAYGKVYIFHQQDPGSAGKDSAEATNRLLAGYPVKFETMTGDKETRAEPMESGFQGAMIYLMKGAWNDAFIDECVAFPRGKYDDQVDAGSSCYSKVLSLAKRNRKEVQSYQG